jgi:hypothetical protein
MLEQREQKVPSISPPSMGRKERGKNDNDNELLICHFIMTFCPFTIYRPLVGWVTFLPCKS